MRVYIIVPRDANLDIDTNNIVALDKKEALLVLLLSNMIVPEECLQRFGD